MNQRMVPLVISALSRGELYKFRDVVRFYLYRICGEIRYRWYLWIHPMSAIKRVRVNVRTKHPIAFASPDHTMPWGTKHDNTSHKGFVLAMHRFFGPRHNSLSMLDLGCAGGQIVNEFLGIGWFAVGLEGSDYSLKHKRANWKVLANTYLFTCNIAKPFRIWVGGKKKQFQLITAWEVLEHIPAKDLPTLFRNIVLHLDTDGYFIASTTSVPDIRGGVDLHQTKMTNKKWRTWIKKHAPSLIPDSVGLSFYQYVRYNAERSFLVYRKRLI